MSVAIEKANFYTWYIYFVWNKVASHFILWCGGRSELHTLFLVKGNCVTADEYIFEGL